MSWGSRLRRTSTCVLLLIVFVGSPVFAGKLSRAWKAYQDGDFTGCRELCIKVLERDSMNTFANYLVGLTLEQQGKVERELYEGLDFTDRARRSSVSIKPSDLDELSTEFGFNLDNIQNLKEKLGKRLLDLISNSPDVSSYNKFIDRIGITNLEESAIKKRNHFAFQLADAQGTIEAFRVYIETYPKAQDVQLAFKRINHLQYLAAKGNADSLLHFIRTYPGADDVQLAERELIDLVIDKTNKTGQISHMDAFRRNVPELAGLTEVKTRFYQTHLNLIKSSRNIDDWILFTETYERSWMDKTVTDQLGSIISVDSLSEASMTKILQWLSRHPATSTALVSKLNQRRMENRTLYPFIQTATFAWGFCDQNGQMMTEPMLEMAYPFVNGIALVKGNDGYRYLKSDLSILAGPYKHALPIRNGIGLASGTKNSYGVTDDQVVLINSAGKETFLGDAGGESCFDKRMLHPLRLDSIGRNPTGKITYIVTAGTRTWLVQDDFNFQTLNIPTPPNFEGEILAYSSGGVFPYRNYSNKFGLIDYRGKIICPPIYDCIAPAGLQGAFLANIGGYGYRCDVEGGSWGMIRNTGVELLKIQFGNLGYFDNGPAPYFKDGRWGYIDENGKVLAPPIYENASVFFNQIAQASAEGRNFLINRQGIEVRDDYHVPQKHLQIKTEESDLIAYNTFTLRGALDNRTGEARATYVPESATDPDAGKIFTYVEEQPTFPGGEDAMYEYVKRNIKHPSLALEKGITGRVYVTFVVGPDGQIRNAKVLRGIGSGCDEEALRLVNKMPPWKPGKQNGVNVSVQFNMPINFTLK